MDNHIKYMQRCLQLAKLGLRKAMPNPSVGAVLVYNNKIIGEGFTSPYGGNHAEVNAIHSVSAKHLLKKSTLYVSLEPCSHYGNTPPCANLIVQHNIPKVVIGSKDPNPKVAGAGIKHLKDNGVEVVENTLETECINLNKRFYTFHKKKRPYIILKWAQTPNGLFAPSNNKQFWITNKYSQQLVHKWRSEEQAILVGDKTIAIDNPSLNVRTWAGKNPNVVIINYENPITVNAKVFKTGANVIVFNPNKTFKKPKQHWIKIDFGEHVLKQIMHHLFELNIQSLFIEGGKQTLERFIDNALWDEARIITGKPLLIQGIKAPVINGRLVIEKHICGDYLQVYKPH